MSDLVDNSQVPSSTTNENKPDSPYQKATAVDGGWESTEVPLSPPQNPSSYEVNKEVVAVTEKRGFPFIVIPLFIIIALVSIGVSFILLKRNQEPVQTQTKITPSVIVASPSSAVTQAASPTVIVSTPTPSDDISDIEKEFNMLDASTLDVK